MLKSRCSKLSLFFILNLFSSLLFSESSEEALNAAIAGMNSFESFRGTVTFGSGGLSGVVSYKKPNSLHVKFSDGRVISANGRVVWVYSPASYTAGKQDVRGLTGGISGLLSGYENITHSGKTFRLKSETKYYEEITVSFSSNNTLKSLRLKPRNSPEATEILLTGVQINVGLPASLFNFHPPSNAQVVENPLNQRE